MTKIPNQDIHSIEIIQKYPKSSNGTAVIQYYIEFNLASIKEVFHERMIFNLPGFLDLDNFCNLQDNFKVRSEGQFFVKSSSYESDKDLAYAQVLAFEDDLRYKLFHNYLNASSCPGIYNVTNLLSEDYDSFYKSFVFQSKSIAELYEKRNKNVNLEAFKFEEFKETLNSLQAKTDSLNNEIISMVREKLGYSLKVYFEQNSNIIFLPVNKNEDANLVIFPLLSKDQIALPADLMCFQGSEIQKMSLVFPFYSSPNTTLQINDYAHGLAHIFLDHPCENYYPCAKGSVQARTPNIEYLTVMSQKTTIDISASSIPDNIQLIQSLLPWDVAALRHSYGMPIPQNVTYALNNANNLEEVFSVTLYNNTLVALSSTGYNIINAESVKFYEIDLRYDHLSNITNQDISFKFILGYDTEVAEIIVNNSGVIILNPDFATKIEISSKELDFNLCDANQSCEYNYGPELVQIYNYNSSIHDISFI